MKSIVQATAAITFLCVAAFTGIAQVRSTSLTAFEEWKSKATSKAGSENISFRGISFSVAPRSSDGLSVNMTVGTSIDVKGLPSLLFIVQPIEIGMEGMVEVGKSGKLRSAPIERSAIDFKEILLAPRMVLPDAPRANAIRLTVTGLNSDIDQKLTIVVPIGSQENTSVLVQVGQQ